MAEESSSLGVFVVWILWFFIVILMMIISTNFLIANVSDTYANVMESKEVEIYRERAKFIFEILSEYKDDKEQAKLYGNTIPKYLIIRESGKDSSDGGKAWEGQVK